MDNALINTAATHETRNEPQEGVPKPSASPVLEYKLHIASKLLFVKGLRNLSGSASRSSSQVVLDARVATLALGAIPCHERIYGLNAICTRWVVRAIDQYQKVKK